MLSILLPTLLRHLLLPVALANSLTAPPTPTANLGTITQIVYSGSGCPSNSVSLPPASIGYNTQIFSFHDFVTSDTQNCELHIQGSGFSPGWQVSLAELDVVGSVRREGGGGAAAAASAVRWFWQVYWSDDAADTLTLSGSVDNSSNTALIRANVTEPLWSECIGADGNPGILNVNFRVVVSGDGSFEVDTEFLKYQFRRCQ